MQSFVCVWQVHFKKLANNKRWYLAYVPPELTETGWLMNCVIL